MDSKNHSVKEIEIDLEKYWLIIRQRWWIILSTTLLSIGLVAGVMRLRDPSYKAEAKLLFEASNQASYLVGLGQNSREIKALSSRDDPLATQVQIFKSSPIVEQVIDALQLTDEITGKKLGQQALLENLEIKAVPGTDVLSISYSDIHPTVAADVVNTVISVYTLADIKANRSAAVSAQKFIREQLPQSNVQVKTAEIELKRFKEANGIVDLAQESSNIVSLLSSSEDSLTELHSKIADLSAQVAAIQKQIKLNPQQAYQEGLASQSAGVNEASEKLQTVGSQLALERTRYQESHPVIVELRNQEASLRNLLEQRVGIAKGGSSAISPLSSDLQSDSSASQASEFQQSGQLKQDLTAKLLQLQSERLGLVEQVQLLSSAQARQQQRAQLLPALEGEQRELERKLDAAQKTYETLLDNLHEAKVLENQSVGSTRVISPAKTPIFSSSAISPFHLAAGGGLGMLFGISAAFLADLLDRSVKTVRDIQELYTYPVLGIIPAQKKAWNLSSRKARLARLCVKEPCSGAVVEAYQTLQANLKFLEIEKSIKTMVITSAVAGEGKSEVAANLALSLAQVGHRVLLVDANLRHPLQHKVWELDNRLGLCNVVTSNLSLREAFFRCDENLDVLTAGVTISNPFTILESGQLSLLLREWEAIYDFIIIDSPAILGHADTLTLGRLADNILLVVNPKLQDFENANLVKAKFAQFQSKIVGLVANETKEKYFPDHYFSYQQNESSYDPRNEKLISFSSPSAENLVETQLRK